MATEAQKRATLKYDAAHTRNYHLKLNTGTDADIVEQLSRQESIQGYIKQLIRADIECSRCEYWNECTKCIYDGDSLSKRLSDRKRTR